MKTKAIKKLCRRIRKYRDKYAEQMKSAQQSRSIDPCAPERTAHEAAEAALDAALDAAEEAAGAAAQTGEALDDCEANIGVG